MAGRDHRRRPSTDGGGVDMAGAYCNFCDHRCFVLRRLPEDAKTQPAWLPRELHMATCPEGMEHDRAKTGYDHTTAINPIQAAEAADVNRNSYLHIGDMTWPHPADPDEIQWRLRYGTPTRSDLLVAASFIEAYGALIDMPQGLRNRRIGQIRTESQDRSEE